MYLKRVELAGFKSFADKTEFEFVPGITAVVGPNGSGKSNITDAIRWVLGEQSAKSLRGAKMEDIIFAGSDSRKPVNFAEVSLTLNNEDHSLEIEYSEVTITRRLFRSGESEYYINNQACRLRDINELLMDTGLGKEAYSIIGQGKIDEILSSKPEDRRGIFEEAAGIVKFKTRKKEAKKKLEDTEQNLIRISDLISELEVQINPLEKQAVIAKKYREYANKLKELNIQIYVHDIEDSYQDWQETNGHKKELTNKQVELGSEVNQIDATIEKKRWFVNQLEKELEELNKELVTLSEQVEQAEGKKEVLKEREKNQQTNKSQTLQSIDRILSKKADVISQIDNEKDKLKEIDAKINDISEQLTREENALNQLMIDHTSEIEKFKAEYFDCMNDMATLRNEIRHTTSAKESLIYRMDKLKLELTGIEEKKIALADKKHGLENSLNQVASQIEDIMEEFNQNVLAEKDWLNTKEQIQTEINHQRQSLNTLFSRHEVLSEMQSDFSGFHQGVKEILKLRESSKISGIHGAVAELINVPKKFEIAIEIALGSSLQYIVVERESVGRDAIAFLKEKRLGRATFLPLDIVKGKTLNEYDLNKITGVEGYIGPAVQLVNTESKYTSIIASLLGNMIVVTDLKVANKIARILGYSKRIVTLDGDIVNPGGSMTGGSTNKKNIGLLGRQRELEELAEKITLQKHMVSNKQIELQKIEANLQKIKTKLDELRSHGEEKRLKEQELMGNIQQLEYEYKNIEDRFTTLDQEIKQLNLEFKDLVSKEKELTEALSNKQIVEKELQEKITYRESIRKQDESVKQKMAQTITDLKILLARTEQEKDGSIAFIERLTSELTEIVSTIEQHQQVLIELDHDMSTQLKNQESISQAIDELRFKKDKMQKEIEEKRLLRSKRVQEIDTEYSDSKELRKTLKTVESGLHQYEVKLSRLDVELENLLKKLAEEYEMSYEWAKQNIDVVENIDNAKSEVKELKINIQQLGDVNLGAIEEYDRVSERFKFLSAQKEDLVQAKETLYQVIQEVDEEMSIRFAESFEAIREQFQTVFTMLFGGGRADLILTDVDNILDTGIEIVAQPPGKKLQNLALLSGGEKALTAITLLFAILRVKPVPFCVLDEVEAALDEANVSRFAEYLREFCEQTQFIVVTHRKGTMEGSDVLYGVTMQESGVSRLVSVKLEEKEETIKLA